MGDGGADFATVSDSSEETIWLNAATGDTPDHCRIEITASGTATSENNTVILKSLASERLSRLHGCRRAGKVNRYSDHLQGGTSLIPRWFPPITVTEGLDTFERSQVRFIGERIFKWWF